MAQVTGGLGTSHVPIIGRTMAAGRQREVPFGPFFEAYGPVHQWIGEKQPDVAVLIYNDHGLNFFLDNMPTFAVGTAAAYTNADEGWGEPSPRTIRGAQDLSWHIVNSLVADEFDVSTCRAMALDHAGITAVDLVWGEAEPVPVEIVPIVINAVQPPFPTPRRCYRLGEAIGRAIRFFVPKRRVLVIGSGGLSHELGQFGKINREFDRFCLDTIAARPEALTGYSNDEIVDLAGAQGIELMTWLVMRGALGASAREVTHVYHAPISHTGGAMMLLEPTEESS